MAKLLSRIMTFLAVVVFALASSGCKTTKTTEVNKKFLGGTESRKRRRPNMATKSP